MSKCSDYPTSHSNEIESDTRELVDKNDCENFGHRPRYTLRTKSIAITTNIYELYAQLICIKIVLSRLKLQLFISTAILHSNDMR